MKTVGPAVRHYTTYKLFSGNTKIVVNTIIYLIVECNMCIFRVICQIIVYDFYDMEITWKTQI